MKNVLYCGGSFVKTEQGEALDVRQMASNKMFLDNGERAQVKLATLDATTNATTELIPAIATKRVIILALLLSPGATATSVTFKSASTAISPVITLAVNTPLHLPLTGGGWIRQTNVNEAINVTLSNGSAVGIIAHFIELPIDVDLP